MGNFFDILIGIVSDFREEAGSFISSNLLLFQLGSVIISGILVWGIIYAIVRSKWINRKTELWMDYLGVGDVGKRRQLRAWKQIVRKMRSDDINNWKTAIIDADKILDDIVKSSGYRADTADERIKQLAPEALSNSEEVKEAHRVRNRVAQEPDFMITKEEALATLKIYKKSFQEFGLLD